MDKNKYLIRFEDKAGAFLTSVYFCNFQSPQSSYIKALIECMGRTAPLQKAVVNALLSVLPPSAGIMVEDKWYKRYPNNKPKVEKIAVTNNWRVGADEGAGLVIISEPVNNYVERTDGLVILTYKVFSDAEAPQLAGARRVSLAH